MNNALWRHCVPQLALIEPESVADVSLIQSARFSGHGQQAYLGDVLNHRRRSGRALG